MGGGAARRRRLLYRFGFAPISVIHVYVIYAQRRPKSQKPGPSQKYHPQMTLNHPVRPRKTTHHPPPMALCFFSSSPGAVQSKNYAAIELDIDI